MIYDPNPDLNRKYLVLLVCLIHFLLGLDINIVSVSLPALAIHFNVSAGMVTRVVWVYFLVITGTLLIFGKTGDIKGFRKIYVSGIWVFLIGLLLTSVASDFNLLVLFRVLQAVGASVLFALTPAVITKYIPAGKRGKIFGLNYAFTAIGGIVGRSISGFLVESMGWNSIFLINIPFGMIALYLGYRYLAFEQNIKEERKFDYIGGILLFMALLTLMYAINTGQELGWLSLQIILSFLISLTSFVIFFLRQKSSAFPLFNLSVIREKKVLLPVVAFALVYIITNGTIFIFPFFLQWVKAFPKEVTGLIMAVPSAFQMISGFLAGSLSDSKSIKYITFSGAVLALISFIMFLWLSPSSGYFYIILSIVIYGIAMGVFIPANTNRIMSSAKENERGIISGFMTTVIRIGSALGVCFFGALFSIFVPQKNPFLSDVPIENILTGFQITFLFGVFIAVLLIIISIIIREKKS